jgi:Astacin (Peptidase family M12A)
MAEVITCTPKFLPREQWVAAAETAVKINPLNHAPMERLAALIPGFKPQPQHLAVVVTKYWQSHMVSLTVSFLDDAPANLRKRIVQHMNAWNKTANVKFVETQKDGQVRIAREPDGYWSYIGTDVLSIPADQQTLNLQEFTMETPDSEFHRVVRHETGHTMGFPHEHMRRELVNKIDPDKAIKYFGDTQGWSPDEVRAQVLTPIEQSSIRGTAHADPKSIMCYQIPGLITRNGKPIVGGLDIDSSDFRFAALIYPKTGKAAAPASSTRAKAA